MNKLIAIIVAVVLIIAIVSVILLSPKRGGEATSQNDISSSSGNTVETTGVSSETITPTTTVRRECPVSGVSLSVSTRLRETEVQEYPFVISISVNIMNELDESIRLKRVIVTNDSFVTRMINYLREIGAGDYIDEIYGLITNFEDKVITINPGETKSVDFNFRVPDPIQELWQPSVLHNVEITYEIDGLTCVVKTTFTI